MISIEELIKTGQLATGTTTLAVKAEGAIIMATESQATAGYLVATKNAQKLFKISDHVGATISGGVADCQYIIDQARALARLKQIETGKEATLKYITNVIRNLLFQGRSFFLAMMLVAGYDVGENSLKIFGVDLIGSLFEEEDFLSFGSGSTYAFGVLEAGYQKGMSSDEAVELAKRAVTAAKERDIASGSKIQLAVISKDGFNQVM
ncbi:MAG TPA: proteasome subunit beta [Candidatus Lokiarchaeia archaeon]|nr:proteasome subunit beta [Candidatus Lokiarchaeia archaeon]